MVWPNPVMHIMPVTKQQLLYNEKLSVVEDFYDLQIRP